MEKLKNWFSLTTHPDERIQKIELSIWAQSGVFILLIALADVIIRGFFLHRPFIEWATTLGIVVSFGVFFLIRCLFAGVYEPEVDSKEKMNLKLKEKFTFTFFICFVGVANITYHNPLPQNLMEWFGVIIKFILAVTCVCGIEYIVARISWNRSNKG
jgi:Na+-driven multidrug efflux pump